jgi:hypothetical protein
MMDFCQRKNPITLIYQDQRGSLFFLVVDHGEIILPIAFRNEPTRSIIRKRTPLKLSVTTSYQQNPE